MSYLRAGGDGVYNIPALNASGQLYIRGKKFEDYIAELMSEDQLEQSEIDTLRTLLLHLKTDGLTSEWIVNNENKNAVLKTAITAIETKLAKIDTAALTESSVLTNDNRNSVLKTAIESAASDLTALTGRVDTAEGNIVSLANRMTVAEGDIDGVETKTRFITEASISGTGDNTLSTYTTLVGPTTEEKGSTSIKLKVKNAGSELVGYEIKSNFNNADYSLNESTYSHPGGRLTLAAESVRIQATDQCRIGTFKGRDGFSEMDIKIGGQGNKVNIASIDEQNATGPLTEVWIGKLGGTTSRSTEVSLEGNIYVGNARFPQLGKSTPFTVASLIALMSSGPPSWVVGFFSGATSLPYSDVWCMKGGFLGDKDGDVETRNSIMLSELYVVNKSITNITPKVGFFLAKANYSCTQLIGDHRTQVFEGEIVLRNNNITSSSVDWAFTGADDKCNVVNIGGDSGIVIHQGASDTGVPLQIINSCNGSIKMSLDNDGTKGSAKPALEVMPYDNDGTFQTMTRIGFYPGLNQGTGKVGSYQLEVNQEMGRDGIAVAQTDLFGTGLTNVNKINANSINTPGTITGIDVVGSTSISAPTATAGSLVINGNYTGNTDARLYKNADNKLMWNGKEVGAGGVSSGGITYMINVASNITNPDPTPTETIIAATYSGNAQRTITQAVATNTAYYIAKYTTEVFDEASNPVLTGLQQLNQYLVWNSQNQIGQIYGRLWFQATAVGLGVLYQRTYASPITTTPATVLYGTPIPTPKGLYNIKFQRVVFPNINVVVSSGTVVLRYRIEGYDFFNGWTSLTSMVGAVPPSVSSSATNLNIQLDESKILNQTSAVGGKTAVRLVLYIDSGTGTISQTSAGGADLAAYSLIGLGEGTPGLFRTMLYDGANAKINTPYSETPKLIEYDLPIDAPYIVSAFASPTLSTDLYFIQPAGGFANHAITLYFNEGSISHYHSTISPTQTIPTLAQVLNSGATASQPINMNTNKISGITTLEGAANGNWNVKEISAGGTGVSVSSTAGTYTITNNAATQDVASGFGISIAKNGSTATIINNAAVQNLTAGGTGISIAVDTPTRIATITNTGVLSVSASTGISVSTTNGVATITNTNVGATAVAVATTTRDEHETLMEVGALPRKPDYWGANWNVAGGSFGRHLDIYVSVDGKVIVSAIHSSGIKRNTNYGIGDFTISAPIVDAPVITTVCGTSSGSKLFAFGFYVSQTLVKSLAFFSSIDSGLNWSRITSSTFTGLTESSRVRCSGDGTYILASDSVQIAGGRFLFSTDGGASFSRRTLNESLASGNTRGVAMSRSGAVQFILYVNNAETDSRIFQSLDYGATFSEVLGHVAGAYWNRIESDATGRFVYATRFESVNSQTTAVYRSENYGASGSWVLAGMNSIEDIWVSATGQFIAGVSEPNTAINNDRFLAYSVDYGRTVQTVNLGNTTLFRTINGSADGSVLVLGSSNETEGNPSYTGDGFIRIARQGQQNIQDLVVNGGTLTKVGGVYTIATDELWFSGGFEIQTGNPQSKVDFDFLSAGKIDLTQFNIRYEIDCYWSTGENAYIYPLLAINDVRNIDLGAFDNGLSYDQLSGLTNWTNNINNGVYGGAEVYTQSYRNRFFAGYFPASTNNNSAPTNAEIRQRSLIKGTLSLHRRPTAQTGIVDASPNARDILNIFTCDNYATRFYSGMSYLLNSSVQQGTDYGVNHQRINGTGIFSAEPVWSYNVLGAGSQIQAGVFRLGFHLSEGGNTSSLRPRAAHYTYRIYRERK